MTCCPPNSPSAVKRLSLLDCNASLGQQLLGIRYGQTRGKDTGKWMSLNQKIWFAVISIGCPWLRERLSVFMNFSRLSNWEPQTEHILQLIETCLKVASVINFLIFLRRGVHLSITERLLGLRAQFPERQAIRQVSFEFMTRELLWHGFAELLAFILPLINLQRVKNTVLRWMAAKRQNWQSLDTRSPADLTACVVCGEWPVHPHHIGCRHVFCHFCVASNLKADPDYSCPVCGSGILRTVMAPQPVRLTLGHMDLASQANIRSSGSSKSGQH
ncbi:hypothetical protein C0Q70_03969 [Pomacea canaliculata]|uniref:Peroxisome biogenesis factor 2 n=1 Tax=Pomacea canaliculata TaxID=400727 RepID=A0A2T7PU72_POMCA|nr:hypothetical protein C0Q70_03969 [Pomacea canaliculata]